MCSELFSSIWNLRATEDQDGPLPRTKRGRRSPPIGAAGARWSYKVMFALMRVGP